MIKASRSRRISDDEAVRPATVELRWHAHLFYAFNNRGIERTFTNGRYLNQELVNTTSPCPPILNKAARSTGAHVCYNRPHEDVLWRSEGRRGGESCRKAAEQ